MSLDKAIQSGKEKRKPYRGAKAVDCTCRNHGSCSWCTGARLHSGRKQYEKTVGQEDEYHFASLGGDDPTDANNPKMEEDLV